MNNRLLGIAVFIAAVFIFWGNYSAARTGCESQFGKCYDCRCTAYISINDPDKKKGASCTVVFNSNRPRITLDKLDPPLVSLEKGKEEPYTAPIENACRFTVYCDTNAAAELKCVNLNSTYNFFGQEKSETEKFQRPIWGNQKCGAVCESSSNDRIAMNVTCDHWERKKAKTPAKKPTVKQPSTKKRAGERPGMSGLSAFLIAPSYEQVSPFSSFASTGAIDRQFESSEHPAADRQDRKPEPIGIINDTVRWKPLNGEAGLERGVLMVMEGETEAQSYCIGDTIKFSAPMVVTMPTCPNDASGHWEGAFARPRPKGVPPETPRSVVPMILDLRQVNGSLAGELKTPDGTFTVSGSQSGANIGIEAKRAGSQANINLQGNLTRGTIVFGGSEQSAEGVGTYRLVGYFKRIYIADNALPAAVLNAPYNFTLTAFAPGGQNFTFRLKAPSQTVRKTTPAVAVTPNYDVPVGQKEINWFTQAENLRGRNGERFTFFCPPNGSLNGYLYGTDVYSDSSSICKAAVHAGLITKQAGGTVTIEIGPNAAAYPATTRNGVASSTYSYGTGKGSFAFVGAQAKSSVSSPPKETASSEVKRTEAGRLPRGVSFDPSSGTFSGTPNELGNFEFNIVADDGFGNVFEQRLSLTVGNLAVTNHLLHDAFFGEPYEARLTVTGGQPPYRFSGTPPRGLQLDPATGMISGTPLSPMPFAAFDVTIRDSQNNTETQKVTMSVRSTTILGSHYLPDASVGAPYRTQFQAVGNRSPVIWNTYPTDISLLGLSLNEQTGEILGTPTRAGSFLIQMRAEAGGSGAGRSFTLTIE